MPGAIWNPAMEAITPSDQRLMEREKLGRQLQYVYANSPFYQRKFQQADLEPGQVENAEDLSRLPLTTKAELSESQARTPPFGDYLAVPLESLMTVHRTSGSTGRFIYTVLTKKDMGQTNECGARAFWAGGLRPRHRVVHCLNYTLWAGGYTDHRNLERTGATVVPFGVGNSAQLVRLIKELEVDVISSTPSYPNRLEEVVRDELGVEPRELGLKLGLFGGEPGLEMPGFRKRIEDTWGMKAANANYGMSDVLSNFASVCDEVYQLHFQGQGAVLAQLIDPSTCRDLTIEEGITGELVLTSLDREAQPLVRYRTRDVVNIRGVGLCACGRTGFRFGVVDRSDDMLHVKGINVFPSGIAQVLNAMVPAVTGEFQVVLSHPGPYDSLHILVETGNGVSPEGELLKKQIEAKIKQTLTFNVTAELVPVGSIPSTEVGKALRVVRKFR